MNLNLKDCMTKQDMLSAIDGEIEDRTIQANESGESEKYTEELKGLNELKALVDAEAPLTFNQYEWLSYLCANSREQDIRSELE